MISEETRENFMQSIYDMFSDDCNNNRANQIIDIFDIATENCIELPCKVGDTVYFIKSAFSYLKEPKQEMIRKVEIYCAETIMRTENKSFAVEKIGKTVFLTKEAAEQALRESENNE